MLRHTARLCLACVAVNLALVLAAACGARTGLNVDPPVASVGTGGTGGTPAVDSGPDVQPDRPPPPDVIDAGSDAADAGPDVIDAGPDVIDAGPDAPFDAPPPICDDAGVTFIYVVTSQNALFSYYPPNNAFTPIGVINCPAAPNQTPYSMAVDRGGTAYVVFTDGNLFQVDTANAACKPTPFVAGLQGFNTFGMGFTSNIKDPGETLYVAEASFGSPSKGLASIDTTQYLLSYIGPFAPPLGRTELTGTGDGRLFGFSLDAPGPGGHLSQIDPVSAKVLKSTALAVGDINSAFAFAFWGDDFYIFTTAPGSISSITTRYRPADGSLVQLGATGGQTIVGAGVSTCAPH